MYLSFPPDITPTWIVYLHCPRVFHNLMVLSRDPDTIWRLSAENATLRTSLVWPTNWRVVVPLIRNHKNAQKVRSLTCMIFKFIWNIRLTYVVCNVTTTCIIIHHNQVLGCHESNASYRTVFYAPHKYSQKLECFATVSNMAFVLNITKSIEIQYIQNNKRWISIFHSNF